MTDENRVEFPEGSWGKVDDSTSVRLPKPKPGETYIEQTPTPETRYVEFVVQIQVTDANTPMPSWRVSLGTDQLDRVKLTVLDTASLQITQTDGAWDRPPHPLTGIITEAIAKRWGEAQGADE
jgi:hypothetical protein